MKTSSSIKLGIAAMMLTPVFAIEAPVDNSPPPVAADIEPAPAPEMAKPEQAAAPIMDRAYLGVVTAEIPEMLAEHLALKAGEGVLVQAVAPDSPAAKAGISNHDIITRIGGKAVASPDDLLQLMATHKPEDVIHLEMIHQGKPSALDITLGSRPQVAAENPRLQPLDEDLALDGIPKEMADRIRGAIRGNLGGFDLQFGDPGGANLHQKRFDDMKKRVEQMRGMNGNRGMLDMQSNASIRLMDNEGSVEMKSNQDGKEFTIRDKENNITWSGPWDTAQDKAAAPPDVRDRIERLNIQDMAKGGGMFKLQLDQDGLGINPRLPDEENPK